MNQFTLDVRQWRSGNRKRADSESLGGDQTMLFHPDYTVHNMCVMGQMLAQAGARPVDLSRLTGADTYLQFMLDRHLPGSWETPQLINLLQRLVGPDHLDPPRPTRSRFARDLENINDDVFVWCSVAERIGRLRARLQEEGITMHLINYGYGTLIGG